MSENASRNLRIRPRQQGGTILDVTPQSAGWRYAGLAAYRLSAGETLGLPESPRERCVVVSSGIVTAEAGGWRWPEIGERSSVFEDQAPYAVYLPGGATASFTAHTDVELAMASAPDPLRSLAPRLIEPGAMARSQRGRDTNLRYICDILPSTEPAAHLLVVEVRTPAGHSSSYPPHKHDRDEPPEESLLEEIYYHRIDPPSGFAFQRVYTDDRSLDEAVVVEDHDVVLVPRGYHPVVMPYGYRGYYLNVMAGPTRQWQFRNDPAHEWLLGS